MATTTPAYPPILFFHHGTVAQGAAFFRRLWPEARVVSDTTKRFYTSFGLVRGTLSQLVGPGVLVRGLLGVFKGHGMGRPVGDPWLMPGAFLIREDQVLWEHRYRDIGDHPDFVQLLAHVEPTT